MWNYLIQCRYFSNFFLLVVLNDWFWLSLGAIHKVHLLKFPYFWYFFHITKKWSSAFQLTLSLPLWACIFYEWPSRDSLNTTIMPNRCNIYNCKLRVSQLSVTKWGDRWIDSYACTAWDFVLFMRACSKALQNIGIFWDITSHILFHFLYYS